MLYYIQRSFNEGRNNQSIPQVTIFIKWSQQSRHIVSFVKSRSNTTGFFLFPSPSLCPSCSGIRSQVDIPWIVPHQWWDSHMPGTYMYPDDTQLLTSGPACQLQFVYQYSANPRLFKHWMLAKKLLVKIKVFSTTFKQNQEYNILFCSTFL